MCWVTLPTPRSLRPTQITPTISTGDRRGIVMQVRARADVCVVLLYLTVKRLASS